MKTEFALAFKQVINEKNLPEEIIIEALKDAMVSAYRRSVNASSAQKVDAEIDLETGKVTIFVEKEVVDEVQDNRTEVLLEEAKKVNKDTEFGDLEMVESTPVDFGRVAAQTARQVIQQRIRQAERLAQYEYYNEKIGEIVTGVIQAVHRHELTIGLNINAEGKMPRNQQIAKEYYRVHDRIRALLLDVEETTREPRIVLSRAHRDFLRRLLENEVPEIYQGLVEIRSIAREAGYRSKVAVAALKPGVDPVGACVGIRGVRIQAIVRELSDEKIDVIEWNPNTEEFIAKALSPARVLSVFLNKETDGMPTATVVVPEDQLSLAIGRNGQNARLAAKLSGWRIDIKGLFEGTSDTLFKIQDDPKYAQYQDLEATTIPRIEAILGKKAEGRPITPEEYRELHNFNNRVESGLLKEKQEITKQHQARIQAAKGAVPDDAYDLPIMTLGLPTKVENLLGEAGFGNVGELAYRLLLVPGSIQEIDGIGPSYIRQIESALEVMISYQPLPEELSIPDDLLVESESDSPKGDEIKTKQPDTEEEEAETAEDVEEATPEENLEEEAETEGDLEEGAETEGGVEEKAETGQDTEEEMKESSDEEESEELADEEVSGSEAEDDTEEEILDSEEVIEEEQIETEVEEATETAVVEEPEVDAEDKVETNEEGSKAPEAE
ncbi:MAG: transcription termination/antitermination protein NusA [Anaerolineales bacterium]|nr:transcription termination/antitermination protein NusA [Anaerolineales bacterium]